MRHPPEGVLRRLLDEPAGVTDADRKHVADCQDCLRQLAEVREDAELVHAALATEAAAGTAVDIPTAWNQLSTSAAIAKTRNQAQSRPGRGRTATGAPTRASRATRFRATLRRPVVAAFVVVAVLAGAGIAAANDWVQVFQTERITPINISAADLNALPDLTAYGDVAVTSKPDVHPVASAAAATSETGLDLPKVTTLPRGVNGDPLYQVGGEASITFTFSADRAARTAAKAGHELPSPPPGLDGTAWRLVAGPGVAAVWAPSGGLPALVVARATAPRAFSSSDVPFETWRDYLLSLPGLPPDVAASLRTLNADGSTLPLPIPTDRVKTSSAEVDGQPATVLTTRDRALAAVVWIKDHVVTVVAGSVDTDEVVTVARGLR